MRHEKTIKRADGTKYLLCIDLYIDQFKEVATWKVQCWYREKRKRSWEQLPDTVNTFTYMGMSYKERDAYDQKNILRFVTPEEILEAKLELWNKIKPV